MSKEIVDEYSDTPMLVSEYIEKEMIPDIYDQRGITESAQYTANRTAEAFGRLIQLLADKDQLTADEIGQIVRGYSFDIQFYKT